MNLIQSLSWFFFKYFLVRYFKYLPENLVVATTVTTEPSSVTSIVFPKFPTAPSTLIWSIKYLEYEAGSKTPFSVGDETSTVKVLTIFCFLEVYYNFLLVLHNYD